MWISMYLITFIIIYIKSFKDNFTAETLEKVSPVLILGVVVVLLLSILSSVMG